jgi:hypothetical protein
MKVPLTVKPVLEERFGTIPTPHVYALQELILTLLVNV